MPFSKSKEAAWIEVEERLHKAKVISIQPNKKVVWYRAVAAAGAVLLALSGGMYVMGNEQFETTNQTAQMNLPDGSSVMLNTNSLADFNSMTWMMDREVNLDKGEAFFEVEKGSTFTVNTPLGDVEVLGTSFDVLLENNQLTVACKTGKVKVENEMLGSDPVFLEPGMQVVMTAQNEELSQVDLNAIDAWVTGLHQFTEASVEEVFEVLAETTGMNISTPKEMEGSYTGQFSTKQPLSEILETICKPLNLQYEVSEEDNNILITKKP